MAITINTAPAAIQAAYNDINFICTSNQTYQTAFAVSITAVSDNSGYPQYTCSSTADLQVGNRLTGSTFDVDTELNVEQIITSIDSATEFTTNLLFTVSGTDTGTMTRTQSNFKLKAEVFHRSNKMYAFSKVIRTGDTDYSLAIDNGTGSITSDGMAAGDYIYISGAELTIDIAQEIEATAGTDWILTDKSSGAALPNTGYVCQLKQLATFYLPSLSGVFYLNLKEVLGVVLQSKKITLGGANAVTDGDAFIIDGYIVKFTEIFDNSDGTSTQGGYKISDYKMISNSVVDGETIMANYILNATGSFTFIAHSTTANYWFAVKTGGVGVIDWGDGTQSTMTANSSYIKYTHTYASAGYYFITLITDDLEKIQLNNGVGIPVKMFNMSAAQTEMNSFYVQYVDFTTLSIPAAWTKLSQIRIVGSVLQTINISTTAHTALAFVNVQACALDASSVNNLLIACDNTGLTNGFFISNGGTNAAPTGAGSTAKTNLLGKGWSLLTA